MTIQDQARALMVRHRHMIRNREQSMLTRKAVEIGMPAENAHIAPEAKGGINPGMETYDRSTVGLS
jgi:hypothetical protein